MGAVQELYRSKGKHLEGGNFLAVQGLGLDTFIVKGPSLVPSPLGNWDPTNCVTSQKQQQQHTYTTHKHKTHEGEKIDSFY